MQPGFLWSCFATSYPSNSCLAPTSITAWQLLLPQGCTQELPVSQSSLSLFVQPAESGVPVCCACSWERFRIFTQLSLASQGFCPLSGLWFL